MASQFGSTDIDDSSDVHLILSVFHAQTVSGQNPQYLYETDIGNLTYYTEIGEEAYASYLDMYGIPNIRNQDQEYIVQDPSLPIIDFTHLVNGIDKRQNIKSYKPPYKNNIYIRPLIFRLDQAEVSSYIGLYYLYLKKNNNTGVHTIAGYQRILTEEQIVNNPTDMSLYERNGNFFTFNYIVKKVSEFFRQKNIPLRNITLGLYNCSSRIQSYETEYAVKSNAPYLVSEIPMAPTFQSLQQIIDMSAGDTSQFKYSILNLQVDSTILNPSWSALAKLKTQGCALNVLSYYGIIPQTLAREQTVCLSVKGTSIFRIVDYINNYFVENLPFNKFIEYQSISYFITRFTIEDGFHLLKNFLLTGLSMGPFTIIFKVYQTNENPQKKAELSEIGHTVSILSINKVLYYIDPQSINIELSIANNSSLFNGNYDEFFNYIRTNVLADFNFIDLIFFIGNHNFFTKNNLITNTNEDLFNIIGPAIRERPINVTYGGKKPRGRKTRGRKPRGRKTRGRKPRGRKTRGRKTKNV